MAAESIEVVTVPERKRREATRRAEAARAVIRRLRAFVRAAGHGRFIVFGSAVTGSMRQPPRGCRPTASLAR